MRLIVDFRKPFLPLEDALEADGCTLIRNARDPSECGGADACLLDFCDTARHLSSAWKRSRLLRRRGTAVVALDRDAPWHKGVRRRRLWLMGKLGILDLYASHSMQGAQRFAPHTLYLPNAARIDIYNLGRRSLESLRERAGYRHEVSFIGNLNARGYPEHRERVAFLEALRKRLAEEGISLALYDAGTMAAEEQVRLIQSSIINLNVGAAADNGGPRSWGLPERCYGVPACGGFLLSDERRHAQDDFVPGREWAEFAGMEQCAARIRHFLAHFDQTRSIAEAAYARVISEHTYRHRARRLLGAIGQLHGTPGNLS